MRGALFTAFIGLLLIPLAFSSGTISHGIAEESALLVPYAESTSAVLDGVVVPGEYRMSYLEPITGMVVHLQHDGKNLSVAMVSPGNGWAAIEFNPNGSGSSASNVIIGYVTDNGSVVLLDYMRHSWEQHSDVNMGGKDDVIAKSGSATAGNTTLEFLFPLSSGDPNDLDLLPGNEYTFSLAYNATSKDLNSPPTTHSEPVRIKMDIGPLFPLLKTSLAITIPEGITEDREFPISALLVDENGLPRKGERIAFYLKTTFGMMELGSAMTNSQGIATIYYVQSTGGSFEIVANYDGSSGLLASSASMLFTVQGKGDEIDPIVQPISMVVAVVATIVFGIFATYGFVLYEIHLIAKEGKSKRRWWGYGELYKEKRT